MTTRADAFFAHCSPCSGRLTINCGPARPRRERYLLIKPRLAWLRGPLNVVQFLTGFRHLLDDGVAILVVGATLGSHGDVGHHPTIVVE